MLHRNIELYKSLFHGREDLFAIRWEKNGKTTYIWHVEKNRQELRNPLRRIDQQLSLIRNKSRQAFLESQPMNFSRILHDYSDEQKGFTQWKDLLQERLV